ncbi:MAG: hypothetical protein IT203_07975 [Fimbriimonadaceae bacterium]|nr:hypothetical protein [Fimbriimonadaceae bacterium]
MRFAIFCALATVLVGCSRAPESVQKPKPADPFAPFVGKWADKPEKATVSLEVTPDRKFKAIFVIDNSYATVQGETQLKENKLALVPQTFNGRAPKTASESRVEMFTLGENGQTLLPQAGPPLQKRIAKVAGL